MSKKTKKQKRVNELARKALKPQNPALVREAAVLDQQLRQQWGAFRIARRAFGEIVLRIQQKKLHRLIANPKSRKGYVSLWAYVREATGGEISRSTMFAAMKVARLTKGPHALPAKVIDALPIGQAHKLTQIPAHKRLQLVKKTAGKPAATFTKEAAKAEGKKALVEFKRKVHPLVATKLAKTIASFVDKAKEPLNREETAILAMCAAAERGRKIPVEKVA